MNTVNMNNIIYILKLTYINVIYHIMCVSACVCECMCVSVCA